MKCPQCRLIERIVKCVENNIVTHECKKCGKTEKEEIKLGKQ